MKTPSRRMNNAWCYAGPSTIDGRGLFARIDIPAGTDIVEYDGPRISVEKGKRFAEEGNVYVFRLNRREIIEGSVAWNLGRHANHSCESNAASVGVSAHIWLRAKRLIAKGEEITYDYGYTFRDDPVPCRCGAKTCARRIVASRHR